MKIQIVTNAGTKTWERELEVDAEGYLHEQEHLLRTIALEAGTCRMIERLEDASKPA